MFKGTGSIVSLCRSMGVRSVMLTMPLPSRSDACVAPYWVLPDAEIGRTGSKAAFLPSCTMGEKERNCPAVSVE